MKKFPLQLRPSKISGVGVFATIKTRKGFELSEIIPRDWKFIKKKEFDLDNHFGVQTEKGMYVPKNYGRMALWWYLNHSDNPNVNCEDDNFVVMRNIKKDEELTIDYEKLDKKIDNSLNPIKKQNTLEIYE